MIPSCMSLIKKFQLFIFILQLLKTLQQLNFHIIINNARKDILYFL
jgi:hypothetical protein